MRCPFLREAQVKFCCASEFKKMIVRSQGEEADERCSSPDYTSCPAAKQRHEDAPSQARCPFLQESLVQYCSAASTIKYVPYSDPNLTKCGTSSHHYCELYLTMSNPGLANTHEPALETDRPDSDNSVWLVDGIQTTGWHYYSSNHMWADIDGDGKCHIGLDAFITKVLGTIEKLTFAITNGEHHPGVVVTSNGIDFPMVFPNRIGITSTNSHLRAEPSRIVADPYTFGWLYEGAEIPTPQGGNGAASMRTSLIHGLSSRKWMEDESKRLSLFVHELHGSVKDDTWKGVADGGNFDGDLIKYLSKAEALLLYSEFFSPNVTWEEK